MAYQAFVLPLLILVNISNSRTMPLVERPEEVTIEKCKLKDGMSAEHKRRCHTALFSLMDELVSEKISRSLAQRQLVMRQAADQFRIQYDQRSPGVLAFDARNLMHNLAVLKQISALHKAS